MKKYRSAIVYLVMLAFTISVSVLLLSSAHGFAPLKQKKSLYDVEYATVDQVTDTIVNTAQAGVKSVTDVFQKDDSLNKPSNSKNAKLDKPVLVKKKDVKSTTTHHTAATNAQKEKGLLRQTPLRERSNSKENK